MISASAPGKIILLGEHAVVYGHPALAIPVLQVGVTVSIEVDSTRPTIPIHPTNVDRKWMESIQVDAADIGRKGNLASYPSWRLPDPITDLIQKVFSFLGITATPPLSIRIESSIPVASGLGSGAAVSVALIRALAASFYQTISNEQVSQLAFEIEKHYHGTPSGIDNTVITYSQPVFFVKDQPIQTFKVGKPFTLVIADSGIRAATRESVGDVRKQWLADPERVERIFASIADIVHQAHDCIQDGQVELLGKLMNQNQTLLQKLNVSSPELDLLIEVARRTGALGAKLSGGGRGGNLIALVTSEDASRVERDLLLAGAIRTIVTQVT